MTASTPVIVAISAVAGVEVDSIREVGRAAGGAVGDGLELPSFSVEVGGGAAIGGCIAAVETGALGASPSGWAAQPLNSNINKAMVMTTMVRMAVFSGVFPWR